MKIKLPCVLIGLVFTLVSAVALLPVEGLLLSELHRTQDTRVLVAVSLIPVLPVLVGAAAGLAIYELVKAIRLGRIATTNLEIRICDANAKVQYVEEESAAECLRRILGRRVTEILPPNPGPEDESIMYGRDGPQFTPECLRDVIRRGEITETEAIELVVTDVQRLFHANAPKQG